MACASTTLGGLSPNLNLWGTEVRPVGEILCFSSIQAWWDPSHVRVMSMIPFVCPDSVSQKDRSSFSDYCLGFLVFKVAFVCNMSFGSYSDLERQTGAITGRKCKLGGAMNDSPGPGSLECGSPACPLLFKLGPPLRKAPQSQAGDGCSLSVSQRPLEKGPFSSLEEAMLWGFQPGAPDSPGMVEDQRGRGRHPEGVQLPKPRCHRVLSYLWHLSLGQARTVGYLLRFDSCPFALWL